MAYQESAHPRWPTGTPYGLGGQYKPKGVSTLSGYRAWLRKNGEELPEGMPGSGDPNKPTRGSDAEKEQKGLPNKTYGSAAKLKDVKADAGGYLEGQIAKEENLRPYEERLNRALYKLKNGSSDFNAVVSNIPLQLRGEAKMALAKALEGRGFKIAYTKYEDGSTAPTSITSRPQYYSSPGDASGIVKYPDEKGRRMMKAYEKKPVSDPRAARLARKRRNQK